MNIRPKTLFIDIDGVLFKHYGNMHDQLQSPVKLLSGVREKFHEWDMKGYYIILTTGRRECSRKITEQQLQQAGIFYNQLIMGITGGIRVLINDLKPNSKEDTAIAICLKRNVGIMEINT